MMIQIPGVLSPDQVRQFRHLLEGAAWADGRLTAGHAAIDLGHTILDVLGRNPTFIAATLPLKVLPPMFNRYEAGGTYGDHVDNAIRNLPGTAHRVRTDVSCTLFLSDPDEYDGGELVVADTYGTHAVKLPAGHLVTYPGTSLHRVTPVTRGARLAAFFWVQSLVRHDAQRTLLLELDTAIQQLTRKVPGEPALVQLTGVYHNLLRQWSNT